MIGITLLSDHQQVARESKGGYLCRQPILLPSGSLNGQQASDSACRKTGLSWWLTAVG
jgi:hypothetical protein